MNIYDLMPELKEKKTGLESKITKNNNYETDYKEKNYYNPLTQMTINGKKYELETEQYENLMQILQETDTKIEEVQKYAERYQWDKDFGIQIENQSITKLQINYYKLTKIPYLEKLTTLKELNLHNNKITDIKGLEKLITLKELNLYNNQITEIKGLETLNQLQEINLWNNQITEIKGLETLNQLQEINLWNNQITEIKGLEILTKLQKLYLHDNLIYDSEENKKTIKELKQKGVSVSI